MAVRIRGVNGSIRWGYHTAATVRSWAIAPVKDTKNFALTARSSDVDPFKVSQRPLTFVAPVQGGEWQLPVLSIEVKDGAVTATLGPPKEL